MTNIINLDKARKDLRRKDPVYDTHEDRIESVEIICDIMAGMITDLEREKDELVRRLDALTKLIKANMRP